MRIGSFRQLALIGALSAAVIASAASPAAAQVVPRAAISASDDWPSVLHDAAGTSDNGGETAVGTAAISSLHPLWSLDNDGSSPVVSDGRMIYDCGVDRVCAASVATGARFWTGPADVGTETPLQVSGGLVLVQDPYDVTALNETTGRIAWTWHMPAPDDFESEIFQVDAGSGYVLVANGAVKQFGLSLATGDQLWSASNGLLADVAISGTTAFETPGNDKSSFYAVDLRTGAVLWTDASSGDGNAVVAGDTVYLGGGSDSDLVYGWPVNGCGQAVCQPSVTLAGAVGNTDLRRTIVSSADRDHLYADYATDHGGFGLESISLSSHQVEWVSAEDVQITSTSTEANGLLFVADYTHNVEALAVGGCGGPVCEPVWRSPTVPSQGGITWASFVAEGHLFENNLGDGETGYHAILVEAPANGLQVTGTTGPIRRVPIVPKRH